MTRCQYEGLSLKNIFICCCNACEPVILNDEIGDLLFKNNFSSTVNDPLSYRGDDGR